MKPWDLPHSSCGRKRRCYAIHGFPHTTSKSTNQHTFEKAFGTQHESEKRRFGREMASNIRDSSALRETHRTTQSVWKRSRDHLSCLSLSIFYLCCHTYQKIVRTLPLSPKPLFRFRPCNHLSSEKQKCYLDVTLFRLQNMHTFSTSSLTSRSGMSSLVITIS